MILWELFSGKCPFDGLEGNAIFQKLQDFNKNSASNSNSVLLPFPAAAGRCPEAIKSLICKCWQFDPAARPSMPEVRIRFSEQVDNYSMS